ncbi:MAG: Tim44/TimA family putative adaptor protein [Rhodospirillaceae bacterium]|nr:Tim44/TimA family putative adaptor protein [Rhodospirillaceae bacterium]
MNNDLILTLIFAAVAAFVLFKLRSVLGRREGHEQRPPDFFAEAERKAANDSAAKDGAGQDGAGGDTALPAPGPHAAEAAGVDPESPAAEGIAAIRAADRHFDPAAFVDGARAAFDMIVEAFAKGDRDTLEPLLAPDVFASFDAAIAEREQAGETLETTIVALNSAELTGAEMQGRAARVTMTFVSEQSNVVKDAEGNPVDGDPATIEKITDIWTFARDTRSRDPNWQLVETDGG